MRRFMATALSDWSRSGEAHCELYDISGMLEAEGLMSLRDGWRGLFCRRRLGAKESCLSEAAQLPYSGGVSQHLICAHPREDRGEGTFNPLLSSDAQALLFAMVSNRGRCAGKLPIKRP
jgi:hypothetical protein